jgi:Fe-S cluster biogenesis protein NfuA
MNVLFEGDTMGFRDMVHSLRPDSGGRKLLVAEAAREEIERRVEEARNDGEELTFFVLTQPSPLGFNVGVGFEPKTISDVPIRSDLEVPVRITDEDFERLAGYTIDFREGRFVTFTDVAVHVTETPNPESRKFIVNRLLMAQGSATFTRSESENAPPLVGFLFQIPGIKSLFFIQNFCSVTKEPDAGWEDLQTEVGRRLQAFFAHGGEPMTPPPRDPEKFSETERKIIEILDDVIRPAVQRDGGDIAFAGYEEGKVQLYMLGSCVGCPSATATLKMGVERLLREAVPEVREVVAID